MQSAQVDTDADQRILIGRGLRCLLHDSAILALLRDYIIPEVFVAAGPQAIAAIPRAHRRIAFGEGEADQLVALCCQTRTRPVQSDMM
jgi:hypothetical protein